MATSEVLDSTEQQELSESKDEDGSEDLFSNLPIEILHHILSYLPTNDIIRTSILCKRWGNLWTGISNIDLEDPIHRMLINYPEVKQNLLNMVDKLLLCHDDTDIDRLRLSFKTPINSSYIYSWFYAAVQHNIKTLEVSLPFGYCYSLPCCLFTFKSLAELRLEMICSFSPSIVHWPNLKKLQLTRVTFVNLSCTPEVSLSFPLLQSLILLECGWENIKHIKISAPKLTSLIFQQCSDIVPTNFCEIEVCASDISYVSCASDLQVNLIIAASLLSNAIIDVYRLNGEGERIIARSITILSGIKGARALTISNDALECLSLIEDFDNVPMFHNLTQLKVVRELPRRTINTMFSLMDRSQNLEVLEISQGLVEDMEFFEPLEEGGADDADDDATIEAAPCSMISRLKQIRIRIVYGQEGPVHLLQYLLKHSAVLEKVVVLLQFPVRVSDFLVKWNAFIPLVQRIPRRSPTCSIEVFAQIP